MGTQTLIWLLVGLIVIISLTEINADLCPDQKVRCPKTSTCCSDTRGRYGCCPYSNATCCSDGNHCCPHGTDCDIVHGRCVPTPAEVKGWTIIYDSFSDQELLAGNELGNGNSNSTEAVDKKKCPDGDKSCPDSYTCCSLASGGYGCCPFKDGICCSDQVHCCGKGQSCDTKSGSCN